MTTAATSQAQKEYERFKKQQQRASETPQQREARLQKMREYNSRIKMNATAEEREAQKEYERDRKKQQRANETPQQREARLQKMKEYDAKITWEYNATITSDEKGKDKSTPAFSGTKEYDRTQKRIQRERETSEQREERLQKAR